MNDDYESLNSQETRAKITRLKAETARLEAKTAHLKAETAKLKVQTQKIAQSNYLKKIIWILVIIALIVGVIASIFV